MILIVAPYSPINRRGGAHLGASRKLKMIISSLSHFGTKIVLVNSAHNDTQLASLKITESVIGGVRVVEITPPTSVNRVLGKFKNIFFVDSILEAVNTLGKPQFIWFYNGYAFEMRLAAKARKRFGVPMILEFEDSHFSRSRGLNPKPYVDYFFWRIAAKYMTGSFVVNKALASQMHPYIDHVELLPGIVPKVLAKIAQETKPFPSGDSSIKIGYFGGLSVEKGADIVLQLARSLPPSYVLHVTGSGPMIKLFESCAKEMPQKLYYYGLVDDETLYKVIAKCDVMLNPHASIQNMNNGVFPFKVIEGVASGRLLISTAVPEYGLQDVLVGVQFVEHDISAFHTAIVESRQRYLQYFDLIMQGASIAYQRFGENALLEKVEEMLKSENH